jgi:hypothetical protein
MKTSKADLHVHTKYSNRPSEWMLRRIGSAECYTEPKEVYDRAIKNGMNFVTISDHNKIDGALDIADLPNTFISCEVTVYFPEDGAKFHLLTSGITENQFKEIDKLRVNIYELRDYLVSEDIIHSLAHPLFRVNTTVSPEHVEKILVLFNRFEGINGTRDPRAAELVRLIFRNLDQDWIERVAEKHDIQPVGETPWLKSFTGGSDDHGGLYIASAYTETPEAHSVDEYLNFLREGKHEMAGASGNSKLLARSFYQIAYQYYRKSVSVRNRPNHNLLMELFHQMLHEGGPVPRPSGNILRSRFQKWSKMATFARMSTTERAIITEFKELFQTPVSEMDLQDYDRTFILSSRICQNLGWVFLKRFFHKMKEGNFIDSLQSMASLAPISLSIAPYIGSFATQHKDESFIQNVARHFDASHSLVQRSSNVGIMMDPVTDLHNRSDALQQWVTEARTQQRSVTLISSQKSGPIIDLKVKNFQPLGTFQILENQENLFVFPPFMEILSFIECERFSELLIVSCGPMALVGVMAAKLLKVRISVLAQCDISNHIQELTDDHNMAEIVDQYLSMLYQQADELLIRHEGERLPLLDKGVTPSKIRLLELTRQTEFPFGSHHHSLTSDPH